MRWLVLGAGVSGLGAAKLLKKLKYDVTVIDKNSLSLRKRRAFDELNVNVIEGKETPSDLSHYDGLITSPGIATEHPLIKQASNLGLKIKSEIDLALEHFNGQLITVTGTNGKSTIVMMIEHILRSLNVDARVCGNIGISPSLLIAEDQCPKILIMELSSYQLETSKPIAADVAIFSNFSEDHLSRHGSMESYFKAKWKIFSKRKPCSLSLVSEDVCKEAKGYGIDISGIDFTVIDQSYLVNNAINQSSTSLSTKHNLLNAAFSAAATAFVCNKKPQDMVSSLSTYKGLPHRCEEIGYFHEMLIINDSKATNIASTLAALESYEGPLTLVLGGKSKGESFRPLEKFHDKVSQLICFGEAGEGIAKEIGYTFKPKIYKSLASCLEDFPKFLREENRLLLFSPACASFDEFENFEKRGDFFRQRLAPYLKGQN